MGSVNQFPKTHAGWRGSQSAKTLQKHTLNGSYCCFKGYHNFPIVFRVKCLRNKAGFRHVSKAFPI